MANIAHIHWQLGLKGGSESVAMHTLESLQEEHNITLFTDTTVDLAELNDVFDTDVDPDEITVIVPTRAGLSPNLPIVLLNRYFSSGPLGVFLPACLAWLNWLTEPYLSDADLVINTKSMIAPGVPTIQYIHYPSFDRLNLPESGAPDTVLLRKINGWIQRFEGIYDRSAPCLTLTNSEWTAGVLSSALDIDAEVVYPPVDISQVDPTVNDREDGFVTLGRISEDKNLERAFNIIDGVVQRGIDTHLHIVGIEDDEEYVEQIQAAADRREYVTFEGEVSRERLEELLYSHRYGLHTKEREHFGIAVAEMVGAGLLPFVHASGGQVDIVGNCDALTYDDTQEAIDKICDVVNDSELRTNLRRELPNVSTRFGKERFKQEIRSAVKQILNRPPS